MANPDRSVYDPPFDDDLVFDTVDDQDTARGRPLMILLGIIVLLAFAGVVWVAYRQGVEHAARSEPPLLAQDPGPTRVAAPPDQGPAVPDNPIYDEIGGAPVAAAPANETLAPAAEEPAALPPPNTVAAAPTSPAPSAAEPAPDTTVGQIPSGTSTRSAPVQPAIPREIAGPGPSVDPLAPGASLPPVVDLPPAAPQPEIAAPIAPSAAEIAAKAEKDRLAKEAAAKKAEAARLAEVKRQQQLAAAQPAAAPPAPAPAPAAPAMTSTEFEDTTIAPPREPSVAQPSTGPRPDASGRPTLLTPPSIDLPAPGAPTPAPSVAAAPTQPAAPPAASSPPVAPPTRSAVVPDETPAPAATASSGSGSYVVQIGAFNSAEDAAASWKRMESSFASALAGASPEIRQTEINGKTKYRLRATGYADKSAAASACSRLKAAGQGCFVAGR